ncbi:MAG TPA: hypothetical protein VMV38_02250 [Candidatus Paceibacterota bacterium]|nr:hypothetical protein [Candidatus Paceibacterota bacterium]
MKTIFSIMMIAGATLLLGACATTADLHKSVPLVQGPVIQTVTGPYDAAKACVKAIPETATINVAVGDVRDVTGRMSVVGDGNGSFMPIAATKMMESSLADTGVKLVNASPVYRGLVDWYGAKGIMKGAKLYVPQYLVEGTISSLDFLPGKATSFRVAGIDVTSRSYQAVGRADFSLATFPYQGAPGGYVVAMTKVSKQFTAVDNGGGVGEFIGGGTGARFASFSLDKGQREPMQYAVGYMTDYAAVNLVTGLLDTLVKEGKVPKDRAPEILQCQALLKKAE